MTKGHVDNGGNTNYHNLISPLPPHKKSEGPPSVELTNTARNSKAHTHNPNPRHDKCQPPSSNTTGERHRTHKQEERKEKAHALPRVEPSRKQRSSLAPPTQHTQPKPQNSYTASKSSNKAAYEQRQLRKAARGNAKQHPPTPSTSTVGNTALTM